MKAQIQQYLVESGNYEKISAKLNDKLLEDGWMDQVRRLTMNEIENDKSANFASILAKIEPQALNLVDQKTKDEVMAQIKAFLDEVVETE